MQSSTFCLEFNKQLTKTPVKSHKRSLPMPEDSDPEDLQPTKRTISKMTQNSIGFSDTVNTCSKPMNPSINQLENQDLLLNTQKDPNFTAELVKYQFLSKSRTKVRNWKKLVPIELVTNLSSVFQKMLKVASLIDQILMRKSSYGNMDAFENVKNCIVGQNGIEFSVNLLKQINFFSHNFYCFYQDPLKNLVIGLPQTEKRASIRRKLLRTICYKYQQRIKVQLQASFEQDFEMPQKQLHIDRIQRFFPIKITKDHKNKAKSPLKKQFIQRIETQISQKDHELTKNSEAQIGITWNRQSVCKFAEDIIKIYNHHKVNNMFRANLLQQLRKQGITNQILLSGLSILQKVGVFLHAHVFVGKSMIYELDEGQKQLALNILYGQQIKSQ